MKCAKVEAVLQEIESGKPEVPFLDLSELQLVLVGGGIGDAIGL